MTTKRLNNCIREAFVRAVMADVPKEDFEEQAKKIAEQALMELMPESVKKLLKDKAVEPWINRSYISMPRYFSNFHGFCTRDGNSCLKELKPEAWKKIEELHEQSESQKERMRNLQHRLENCVASVSTLAGLKKILPEFEKYMPADEQQAIKTLPAIANVVSEFVSAGWPKNKEGATA